MKPILLIFIFLTSSLAFGLEFSPSQGKGGTIAIENRILLKVHNKAITLMDIVRKMDLLFYRQYPEMASSDSLRYQFYASNWQTILQMVIDEELILADAEEKQIPLNDGEVRQEMELLFGPNVVLTLDGLHMTFEEAFALLKRELMVQKTLSAFVRSKAATDVTPNAVRQAYKQILEGPAPENSYAYRMITLRGDDALSIASEVYREIKGGKRSLDEVVKERKLSLSESYRRGEGEIALPHLKVLRTLSAQEISEPVAQKIKDEQVYRIFLLEEFTKGEHPPLSEVEGQLKQTLMQEAYALHNEQYRQKLRAYYDINDKYIATFIPSEFKPFAMR